MLHSHLRTTGVCYSAATGPRAPSSSSLTKMTGWLRPAVRDQAPPPLGIPAHDHSLGTPWPPDRLARATLLQSSPAYVRARVRVRVHACTHNTYTCHQVPHRGSWPSAWSSRSPRSVARSTTPPTIPREPRPHNRPCAAFGSSRPPTRFARTRAAHVLSCLRQPAHRVQMPRVHHPAPATSVRGAGDPCGHWPVPHTWVGVLPCHRSRGQVPVFVPCVDLVQSREDYGMSDEEPTSLFATNPLVQLER
jgi:hypothetical protein